MKQDIMQATRAYMRKKTVKNRAPAWELTEIAIAKAKELFQYYPKVNKKVVLAALYLAHTHFGIEYKNQKNHSFKSARIAKIFLKKFKVSKDFSEKVINAIEAHHNHVPCQSPEAEVMKNAECFKFLTVHGALVTFYEVAKRNIKFSGKTFEQVRDYTLMKVDQKYKLVTLPICKKEAKINRELITKIFNS